MERILAAVLLLGAAGALPVASARAQDRKAHVAVVVRDFNNPYWRAMRDGAVDEGRKLGIPVTVQAGASETDSTGENAKISTMGNQDYTCFGVVPINGTNVITPLLPIAAKGIPVINLDTALDASAVSAAGLKLAGFIGSDNKEAGRLDAEFMLRKLGGKGKVAILEGIPGEQNGRNREGAFRAAVAGKLEVVAAQPGNYERGLGLSVTESMLRVHRDLAGIFSANDLMALGAIQAVDNAGRGGVTVIGVDGVQEALLSVQSGKLAATVSQYPYAEGEMVVQACQSLAQGKSVPASIVSPIKLIDKSNVEQALKATPKPFFSFTDPFGAP